MDNKKKRTNNFTPDEKSVLAELVNKYKEVIENKKTDSTTNAIKQDGWNRLADEFNSLSDFCVRTPSCLKTCWENIKRNTKGYATTRKRQLFKTGGGVPPPSPPPSRTDLIVGSIIGPGLDGLDNPYDSDALELNVPVHQKPVTDDDTEINSEDLTQTQSVIEIQTFENDLNEGIQFDMSGSQPSCSFTNNLPATGSKKYDGAKKANKENLHNWEQWTPNALKRPVSDVLKNNKIKVPGLKGEGQTSKTLMMSLCRKK